MNATTPAHGSGTTPAYGSANVHVYKTGRIASRPHRVLSVGERPLPPTPPRSPRKEHAATLCRLAQSDEWEKHIRSARLRVDAGSRDGESLAARGGPKTTSDGSRRHGQRPKYGRDCADVKALRTRTRLRRNHRTPRTTTTEPGAMLPHQRQTVTNLRVRRRDSASARVCGNRRKSP